MLPRVCSVVDHRGRQNMVRTSLTHSAVALRATFLFLRHFDVICDLLLNRRTATWNLFVLYNNETNYYRWNFFSISKYFNNKAGLCPLWRTRKKPISLVTMRIKELLLPRKITPLSNQGPGQTWLERQASWNEKLTAKAQFNCESYKS